jgi:hypothetical protein
MWSLSTASIASASGSMTVIARPRSAKFRDPVSDAPAAGDHDVRRIDHTSWSS